MNSDIFQKEQKELSTHQKARDLAEPVNGNT